MHGKQVLTDDSIAKDKKGTIKKLFSYLRPYRVSLVVVYIFGIVGIILNSIAPKLIGDITTELFESVSNKSAIKFEVIYQLLILIILAYIFSSIFLYLQSFVITKISQKTIYQIRKDIDYKISKLPLNYFDTKTHGEVLSNVTNDVETINTSLAQILIQVITTIVTIISVLFMMFTISPILTGVIIVTLPLTMFSVKFIVSKSQVYFRGQQKELSMLNSHIEEVYSGHEVVKIFCREKDSIEKLDEINERWYQNSRRAQFISGAIMPVVTFVGNIVYVLIAIIGGFLAANNNMTVGGIQAFIQYTRQFNQPIMQIANIINVFQSVIAAAERIFDLLNQKEEESDIEDSVKIEDVKGSVKFSDVKFGYNEDNVLINKLSFEVKAGNTVAIVGPTGAGKTTIINLLLRFYDIQKGDILIDGISVYKMKKTDLRNIFGMVLQDTWLFNGSIKENIRYGKENATDEEVINAAKSAYADYFVSTLPNGYDFILNEEASNISAGQKQLITIARAMLSDPNILILDEATSNVDTRTEVLIQKAMNKLMRDRTSFVIAHRLSTIRDAESILVLKDGDIVENGNHKELVAQGGYYSELYKSQFEQ
ncbi:MAG: ABC transporter ATP-binding protein [Oscillospiraceae bacterium]